MDNVLKNYTLEIGDGALTAMQRDLGIYQDGTTPMYRDVDGKLWAMSGHSHLGHIAMLSGTCVADLKEEYEIKQNFSVGHADYAYSGIRYPEGVKPRGSIWPFALYICPKTHRFFAFFHNESGWSCEGTEYDGYGEIPAGQIPRYDSDFRHIGLMHSDDEGKHWVFDRWVVTAEEPCFTEKYNPGAGVAIGQKAGIISLGSGDFSFYVDKEGGYFYLFYNIVRVDMEKGGFDGCDVYVARTRLREDGIMGDFVKYYNGAFCEAGNLGRETPVVKNAWHARVVWSKTLGKYVMSSSKVVPGCEPEVKLVEKTMQLRTSDNLVDWSDYVIAEKDGAPWGNHYVAIISDKKEGMPYEIDDEFVILTNGNATNVLSYPAKLVKK